MASQSFDLVFPIAADLRRRFPGTDNVSTFSHVPVAVTPLDVLDRLRRSFAGPLLIAEGTLANHPGDPYRPVQPVAASVDNIRAATVRASTWASYRRIGQVPGYWANQVRPRWRAKTPLSRP